MMLIAFNCPHCGHAMEVEAGYAGQRGACVRCGQPVTAPDVPLRSAVVYPKPEQKPPREPSRWDNPAGVQRRFSLGALLVAVTLYSVFFALLRWHDAPPVVFVEATVFVTGVGLSQMLLFGGKRPRAASLVSGGVLFFVLACGTHLYVEANSSWGLQPAEAGVIVAVHVVLALLFGTSFGYLAGCTAAGIFLFLRADPREEERPS